MVYEMLSRVIRTKKRMVLVADHRALRAVGTGIDVVIGVVLVTAVTVPAVVTVPGVATSAGVDVSAGSDPGGQSAVGIEELTASQALG